MQTPAQGESDRPKNDVTVAFLVESVAFTTGVRKEGDPPFMPIALASTSGLKDRRSTFFIFLVGTALIDVNSLVLGDVDRHFRGCTIHAKGKVRYGEYPRVTQPDGTVKVQADSYTMYHLDLNNLDNFRITE